MDTKKTLGNLTPLFDEKIEPLLKQIHEIATANDLPYFATFQIQSAKAEGDSFVSSGNFDGSIEGVENQYFSFLCSICGASLESAETPKN